ncbi:MAG: LCP family protein [Actinomycetota bacterium]|nr:LCP family protein [Actinomycetota bacterium]
MATAIGTATWAALARSPELHAEVNATAALSEDEAGELGTITPATAVVVVDAVSGGARVAGAAVVEVVLTDEEVHPTTAMAPAAPASAPTVLRTVPTASRIGDEGEVLRATMVILADGAGRAAVSGRAAPTSFGGIVEQDRGSEEEEEEGAGLPKGRYIARHRRARAWHRLRGASGVATGPVDVTKVRTPHRGAARRLLIAVNVAVALSLVVGVVGVVYAEVQIHRINRVKVRGIVTPHRGGQQAVANAGTRGPPMTVLLVGSDTRAALNQPGDSRFGSPSTVGGARSDTIILARVVPATNQLALLSIPRDLYVAIPGMGHQRINAAINTSPDLLIQTIHDQLGIDINHYVDVDFDSFRQIADAVGGVPVYFPTPVRDIYSGLRIPAAGCYNLSGEQALEFVRSREYEYYDKGAYHPEAASDLARIQRQQIFIRKLIKKAEATGLGNPLALNGIVSGLTKNLTVDNTFSVSDIVNLGSDFHSVDASAIAGSTLATTESTLSDGAQVLLADPASDQSQVRQFLALGATPPSSATDSPTIPSAGSSPGTTTTTTAIPSSTVDASTVNVEVVNGSGVAGQAGQASTALRQIGFMVTSVSSTDSRTSGSTEISYSSGGLALAQTVAAHIDGGTTLSSDAGLPASTVKVVLRSSFTGVTSSAGPASSASPSSDSSTSTTVPPTTTTTIYQLPGTPPGQAVPVCGN